MICGSHLLLHRQVHIQPFRPARIAHQFFHFQRAALHRLGMLHHHRVADQGLGDKEAQHLPEGQVPRHDREHGSDRLIDNASRRPRYRLRRQIGRAIAREVPRAERRLLHFADRFAQGFAHLRHDQLAVALCAFFQQFRQPHQESLALLQ